MTGRYSAILFDLDGTLLDSIDLIVGAFQHATREHLGRPVERDAIIPTIGRSLTAVLEELAPGRGAALLATYEQFLHQHHHRLVRLYPQAAAVLRELRARGYPLGIVTAKRRAVARLAFDVTGLDHLVDLVICVEDAPRAKPAPDPLLMAAARLGLAPGACLYVGDSRHDLVAAAAAGMPGAAALWGPNEPALLAALAPAHLLATLTDLLDLCPAR